MAEQQHTIEMQQSKSTKGTIVYAAVPTGTPPACRTVYVERWALTDPAPERITVTITVAS